MPSRRALVRTYPHLLLIQISLGIAAGMSDVWVELRAPRFVVHRHSAALRCEHNVQPEAIYKVVFFKDDYRIMQYIHGRDPPFLLYNFTGAEIKLSKLTSTSITLEAMDFPASGFYACEIALETPLYSKVSNKHEISVIVRQKYRPRIKMLHRKLTSTDLLEATCQSAPAHPAPHLAWFINNVKVDESLTIPNGVTPTSKHHHGMPLLVTNTSLQFPLSSLQLVPNQTVDVTCIGTIPSFPAEAHGYADIQNHTISVNVVRLEPMPTQMPVKIVSADLSSSSPSHVLDKALTGLIYIMFHIRHNLDFNI
ncbi:uncharacterized protein LOC105388390 [Plutella xylostella]|uniref:uncharacterized protein LOC105388390 n=1 Tax=Plutella xylostella TaxID=51655 RepID=UPI002032417E|nr:uncharacterized protein LOC105388390 [Plutella xylostella]